MNLGRTKTLLRLTAAVLVVISVIILGSAIARPVGSPPALAARRATPVAPATKASEDLSTFFDDVLDVRLRPVPALPPRQPATRSSPDGGLPFAVRLTGTIIEPAHCYAVFTTAAGAVEVKAVGESVAGATVAAIADSVVTLVFNGRSVVLNLPRPTAGGSGL